MKDYIVLKGVDGTWTNSRLQFNLSPNAYLKNMPQDNNVDIYIKLLNIDFTAYGTQDSLSHSAVIDTTLNCSNQYGNNIATVLAVVGMDLKQDSGSDWFVSPTSNITSLELKISKFSTISIGIQYQGQLLDITQQGVQNWFTAVLEVSYRDNNTKELK